MTNLREIKVKHGTGRMISFYEFERKAEENWPNAVARIQGENIRKGVVVGDYFYFTTHVYCCRVEIDKEG